MTSISLPMLIFVVWIAWIPIVLLEKASRGEHGGMSPFPIVPVFPLVAWALAVVLNWFHEQLGTLIVGGLHALLLIYFLVAAVRAGYRIRRTQ